MIFSVDLNKLHISSNKLFNKLVLKGRIFNTKIKINYQNKKFDKNFLSKVVVNLPEIGLNLKFNIKPDNKNNKTTHGSASVFFPNNQMYFDYILENKNLNISNSRLNTAGHNVTCRHSIDIANWSFANLFIVNCESGKILESSTSGAGLIARSMTGQPMCALVFKERVYIGTYNIAKL